MPPGAAEAEMAEKRGEFLSCCRVDREFDKLDPVEDRRVGKSPPAGFRLRKNQRTQSVSCGEACRSGPEFVVEDFEGERALIPRGQHRPQKTDDVEITVRESCGNGGSTTAGRQ